MSNSIYERFSRTGTLKGLRRWCASQSTNYVHKESDNSSRSRYFNRRMRLCFTEALGSLAHIDSDVYNGGHVEVMVNVHEAFGVSSEVSVDAKHLTLDEFDERERDMVEPVFCDDDEGEAPKAVGPATKAVGGAMKPSVGYGVTGVNGPVTFAGLTNGAMKPAVHLHYNGSLAPGCEVTIKNHEPEPDPANFPAS